MSKDFPSELVMNVQAKGWMDESLMIECINRFWAPWIETRQFCMYLCFWIASRFFVLIFNHLVFNLTRFT